MTPSHTNSSPGPNHPHSGEDFEMGSSSWPRTPASPVFNNSHAPQTPSTDFSRSTTKVKVSLTINFEVKDDLNCLKYIFLEV
jgi:hypothetical protein